MPEDIQSQLDAMKKEIDALQIASLSSNRPWHRSASVIISLLALLFSFGTTAISYYRTGREDVRNARSELRGMLQRLTALPRDNFELIKKYRNDPEGQSLSASLNSENSLLARQASEILDRYPNDISASEYLAVSTALMAAADVNKIPRYLQASLNRTSDPNVRVAALRMLGAYLMYSGRVSEGRRKYEEALDLWGDYKNLPQYFKETTDAQTEMYWAQVEYGINNVEAAKEHVRKSLERVENLPPGLLTDSIQKQVISTKNRIELGRPAVPLNPSGGQEP